MNTVIREESMKINQYCDVIIIKGYFELLLPKEI